MSQSADVAYKVTAEYAPQCDRGLSWNDPDIGIDWPSDDPILSEKDRALPRLTEIGNPF
ncbi:MAG: dTDP-4-dehydrorhamnose 3,5-epimerase family protein [Gemmatimonadetes bacterium]|nr:dTDP-4-dehydrorhamnose 3,5-epimerase family protein [Gemmatimonadota bacterium]